MDAGDMLQPPKMAIAVIAMERLELTVTKSLLDVVTKLGDVSSKSITIIIFRLFLTLFTKRRRLSATVFFVNRLRFAKECQRVKHDIVVIAESP